MKRFILAVLSLLAKATSMYDKNNPNCLVVKQYLNQLYGTGDLPWDVTARYSPSQNAVFLSENFSGQINCNTPAHEILHQEQFYNSINTEIYIQSILKEKFDIPSTEREGLNLRINKAFPQLSKLYGDSDKNLEQKLSDLNYTMIKYAVGVVLGGEAKKMAQGDSLGYFLNNLSEILPEYDDKHNKIRPAGVLHTILQEWEAYMSEKIGMNYMHIIHSELASVSLWDKAKNGNIRFDALSSDEIINSLSKVYNVVRSKEELREEIINKKPYAKSTIYENGQGLLNKGMAGRGEL